MRGSHSTYNAEERNKFRRMWLGHDKRAGDPTVPPPFLLPRFRQEAFKDLFPARSIARLRHPRILAANIVGVGPVGPIVRSEDGEIGIDQPSGVNVATRIMRLCSEDQGGHHVYVLLRGAADDKWPAAAKGESIVETRFDATKAALSIFVDTYAGLRWMTAVG